METKRGVEHTLMKKKKKSHFEEQLHKKSLTHSDSDVSESEKSPKKKKKQKRHENLFSFEDISKKNNKIVNLAEKSRDDFKEGIEQVKKKIKHSYLLDDSENEHEYKVVRKNKKHELHTNNFTSLTDKKIKKKGSQQIFPDRNLYSTDSECPSSRDVSQSPVKKSKSTKQPEQFSPLREKIVAKVAEDSSLKIKSIKENISIKDSLKKFNTEESNLIDKNTDKIGSEEHILKEEEYLGWPKEDILKLLSQIRTCLPVKDYLSHKSRCKKLDWSMVAFDQYSASDCFEKWTFIQNHLRHVRLMKEMLDDAESWLENPYMHYSRTGLRYADMPKKPLTTYMVFMLAKKDKIASKHPGVSLPMLTKLAAEKYKKLSKEKLAKYRKKADFLKLEYDEKMNEFLQCHPEAGPKKKKNDSNKGKKKITPKKPQKPLIPFMNFVSYKANKKQDTPGLNLKEFKLELKPVWKNMSSKKKYPWVKKTAEEEIKYLQELKEYVKEHPEVNIKKHIPLLTKEEQKLLSKMEGKPDPPPRSAFSLFTVLMLRDPSMKDTLPHERLKEIGKLWQNVPDKEKAAYQERVKLMREKYEVDLKKYMDSLPEERRVIEMNESVKKGKKEEVSASGKKLKQTSIKDILMKKEEELFNETSDEEMTNLDQNEMISNILKREPPQPPSKPFLLFEKELTLSNPELSKSSIKNTWQNLSDKARHKYNNILDEMKQNYLIKFRNFLTSLTPEEVKLYKNAKGTSTVSHDESNSSDSSDDSDSSDSGNESSDKEEFTKKEESSSSE